MTDRSLKPSRRPRIPAWLALSFLTLPLAWGQESWPFQPTRDSFDEAALFDLRELNEEVAGQSGWVRANADGDFELGSGEPVRFWATNHYVGREDPYVPRPQPGYQNAPDIDHAARWLAKRGVNLNRLHSHINPDPATQDIDDVNLDEVEWIWRSVGAMKQAGIYSVVSPYWANTMESDDGRWGTDWNGNHHGLLFFDETLQAAYKEWLRYLFTTPTDYLGGKTLAEEPALAIFQIQNEDSLLFWTVNNLSGGPADRLGALFHDWAVEKYGSIDEAYAAWGTRYRNSDDLGNGVLGMANIWDMTTAGKQAIGPNERLNDQLQFWVETMMAFNEEIERFIHEDLNCPVLVNAGNWKTADVILLEDSERYSYTSNEVSAVNRYFAGVHVGPNRGWAIVNGDGFTNPSVLQESTLSFPINLKQPVGMPMMVTESTWVMPMNTAFESPMLISAYSSLNGVDAYFWFAGETDEWVPPRSANGYLPSQEKWIFLTPDMVGQFPAAALAFRRNYIARGQPVVEEHRALESLWQRKSPVIAETASFDPNRDSGDLPPDSSLEGGVDPLAFLVGPVTVNFASSESNTTVAEGLEERITTTEEGSQVTSITDEIMLDTINGRFTIDTPFVQSLVSYGQADVTLGSSRIQNLAADSAATIVSLDGRPLQRSTRVLVQVAARSRPEDWATEAGQINVGSEADPEWVDGQIVQSYGSAPWMMEQAQVEVSLFNPWLSSAQVLDANGVPVADLPLSREEETVAFSFPSEAMYVALTASPQTYAQWAGEYSWPSGEEGMDDDPEGDRKANLMEFASGGHPLRFDSGGIAETQLMEADGSHLLAVVYHRNVLASEVLDQFEVSSDLQNWMELSEHLGEAARDLVTNDNPGGEGAAEERTLLVTLGSSEERLFVRRKVTDTGGS